MPLPAASPSPAPSDVVARHLGAVRRWCLRRSRGDAHLADDVTQETALAALVRIDHLRDPARLRGWLFTIAERRLIDEVRRRRVMVPLSPDLPAPPPPSEVETEPLDRARLVEVKRALRKLPLTLRRAVRLHYLHGRSLREIAQALHTSPNGIKARLYRARCILRERAAEIAESRP